MREYTKENPVFFSNSIQITESTDDAHADNINAAPKQLLENDIALKKEIEHGKEELKNLSNAINSKESTLNQRITSEKNAISGEITTKVSEAESRVNKKIADEKRALEGVISSKESTLNQRITSEKNAISGEITTKVSEAEGRVNKKITDEKNALLGVINSKESTLNTRITNEKNALSNTINTKEITLNNRITSERNTLNYTINQEAKKRFEELYGLIGKTVTISNSGNLIKSVGGDVAIATTKSKSENGLLLTTVIEKGKAIHSGYEKYTKTTKLMKHPNGDGRIMVSFVRNA